LPLFPEDFWRCHWGYLLSKIKTTPLLPCSPIAKFARRTRRTALSSAPPSGRATHTSMCSPGDGEPGASPAADASPSMVSLRPCRTFRGPAFDRVDATLSRVDNTPDLTLPDLVRRRTSSATSSSPNALQGGPEGVRRFAPNNPLRHPCRKV